MTSSIAASSSPSGSGGRPRRRPTAGGAAKFDRATSSVAASALTANRPLVVAATARAISVFFRERRKAPRAGSHSPSSSCPRGAAARGSAAPRRDIPKPEQLLRWLRPQKALLAQRDDAIERVDSALSRAGAPPRKPTSPADRSR